MNSQTGARQAKFRSCVVPQSVSSLPFASFDKDYRVPGHGRSAEQRLPIGKLAEKSGGCQATRFNPKPTLAYEYFLSIFLEKK